jgi:hypothetical protein
VDRFDVIIIGTGAGGGTLDYYAGSKKADMEDIVYTLDDQRRRTDLQAREVAEVIARQEPSY